MANQWDQFAIDNGYLIICIMMDLEDKELYPVYFNDELSLQRHKDNIISESKVKIISVRYCQ
jgi:hypothetical protein